MNDILVFAVCIKTENGMYRFTAATDGPITNDLISNVIRDGFAVTGHDYISADSVEDICVVFASDTFDGMLDAEIDDVWPSDFRSKKYNCDRCKKGGENYRHGKDDVFKNRR